jgi:hypothetical protein
MNTHADTPNNAPTQEDTMTPKVKITVIDNAPMSAIHRCDRCGGQAYVEVLIDENKSALLFCAHHAREHEEALFSTPGAVIFDHRPYLLAQEGRQRDAASAAK